jgi:hypothetical protein
MQGRRNKEVSQLKDFLGTILLVKPSFLHIDWTRTESCRMKELEMVIVLSVREMMYLKYRMPV